MDSQSTRSTVSQKALTQYAIRARAAGVTPELAQFPAVDREGFERSKRQLLRLRTFLKRNTGDILKPAPDSPVALAFFDRDGCLLDLYGSEEALNRLAAKGIQRGQVWSLETVGTNAVTIGLEAVAPYASVGEEHTVRLLHDCAIYFSPIFLQQVKPPYTASKVGGVAVFLPEEKRNPDYAILAASICHDTCMTMHFNQTANMLYERSGRAIFTIDTQVRKGKNSVTYCSDILFQFFGLKPMDIDFQDAELLIDPPPKNPEFWEILHKLKRVTDQVIPLSAGGRKASCIVTTDVFDQPGIQAQGVIFYITTQEHISAGVSAKMGNSAVCSFESIVGGSPKMQTVISRGKMLARTDSNIMLLGESGVGKDIFAQAIHNASRRKNKPFIAVNCGALPRDLISAELFGYADGAFTGAKKNGNLGKFELANGGTIFLDEIGELPLDLQATLLRAVEQKQFMRVGGNELINVDVKIISATNADMADQLEKKLFRTDLYYRLSTMRLDIPPLREREEDIVLLAEFFIQTIAKRLGRTDQVSLTADARRLLRELTWPGNVRELQNLIESVVQLNPTSVIEAQHILDNLNIPMTESSIPRGAPVLAVPREKRRGMLTRQDILDALDQCGDNRSEAARYLGISRKTLYRNMERLDIQ